MAARSYPAALAFVLRAEGGNVHDPHDPGGRTSRGVTQSVYDAWRARHVGFPADVFEAPQAAIEAIYREQYWQPYGDKLPAGADAFFFDFCVNAGRQQAVKTLQRALGVKPDGMLGMVTLEAIAKADAAALIRTYAERRRDFYRALKGFKRYGKGWLSRTAWCEQLALSLAAKAGKAEMPPPDIEAPAAPPELPAPEPHAIEPVEDRTPRAEPTDLKEPTIAPETGAVVSTSSGSIAGMLEQLQQQLAPIATYVDQIQLVLIGIAIVGFGLTIWGFLHRRKMRELAG